MAKPATFMAISMFFTYLSLSSIPCITSRPNGFTLKLVHRDSPFSPLYQPNLSNFERFKKNLEISKSRALYFQQLSENRVESSKASINTTIRLPLKENQPLFTVELSLGTPAVQRTLIFDTGSGITWTQCKPCIKCFRQKQPLFDKTMSKSYMRVSKEHKLVNAFTCIFSYCYYYVLYYSGQFSVGIASTEAFTIKPGEGVSYRVNGIVFGCGIVNMGSYGPSKAVTGILGMDKNPISFARQLGGHIKSRFSYCLPTINATTKESYLSFGEEAIIRTRNYQSLPFLNFNKKRFHYSLNLTDISIGGERLGLNQAGAFPKGCVIDSGSSVSLIENTAYNFVEESIQRHFSKFKNVERIFLKRFPRRLLCYSYTGIFKNFPNMTFHFKGADLAVPPENLFLVEKQDSAFCLLMTASRSVTLLGAYQQQNMRFVYDLDKDMLSFAKEDCSK